MTIARRLSIVVLSIVSVGGFCQGGGGGPVPESEVCRMPAGEASIDTLAVRSIETREILSDGDALPFTVGGQGTTMIGVRLVLTGADVPACMAQETTVTGPEDEPWASASVALPTTERPDGTFITGDLWLFPTFDAMGEATVRTEAYGVTHEVRVRLE